MGKNKNKSTSKLAHSDNKNAVIANTKTDDINPEINHTEDFLRKHRISSRLRTSIHRRWKSINDISALSKFYVLFDNFIDNDDLEYDKDIKKFVCNDEYLKNINLSEASKTELRNHLFYVIEKHNRILNIRDDSFEFRLENFKYPKLLELYLYKLFYPRIFDFNMNSKNEIIFADSYINDNFKQIFTNIRNLVKSIILDAFLIAIYDVCFKHIKILKESAKNPYATINASINGDNDVSTLIADLELLFKQENDDTHNSLLPYFKDAIIFLAKHHSYTHNGTHDKKIGWLLGYTTIFSKKRADESRKKLMDAYDTCRELFDDNTKPFTKLLNIYCINLKSHFFDLDIMQENIEFKPHLIDGILTKYTINKIIHEYTPITPAETNPEENRLRITSIHNDPNYSIDNISPRDYETINFLITRTAKALILYYLTDTRIRKEDKNSSLKERDQMKAISASEICKYINKINNSDYFDSFDSIPFNKNRFDICKTEYDDVTKYDNSTVSLTKIYELFELETFANYFYDCIDITPLDNDNSINE